MKKSILTLFLILFTNSNILSQWTMKNNGLPDTWMQGLAIDAGNLSSAVISISTLYSHLSFCTCDAGNNWVEINLPGEIAGDISIIDNQNIWIATISGKIYHSSNGGIDWEQQFFDQSKTTYMNFIKMFDTNNGIAMGDGLNAANDPALFLKTTNGGITWEVTNNTPFGGWSGDTWRRLDFVSPQIGYFYESGVDPQKLYKTTDGGYNWVSTTYEGGGRLVKFYNENIGLLETYPGELYRTLDGGSTWETFLTNADGWPTDFEFLPSNPNFIWYTTTIGFYYSTDMGETWNEHYLVDGELQGRDIVFTDDNHGWLLCDNGRVYYTENNGGIITDVDENEPSIIPTSFQLMQNYPNPFNPTTTIKYSIPAVGTRHAVSVRLTIYDLLGEEIITLISGQKSPGIYQVEFDGSVLTSGIYFYTLQAGNFIETKKFVLMK